MPTDVRQGHPGLYKLLPRMTNEFAPTEIDGEHQIQDHAAAVGGKPSERVLSYRVSMYGNRVRIYARRQLKEEPYHLRQFSSYRCGNLYRCTADSSLVELSRASVVPSCSLARSAVLRSAVRRDSTAKVERKGSTYTPPRPLAPVCSARDESSLL